jgi:hypothetical protein
VGKSGTELKKQLKIVFAGEEGVDEGGVKVRAARAAEEFCAQPLCPQKEFFQILIRRLIDADFGTPLSHLSWSGF